VTPRDRYLSWTNLSRAIAAGTPQRFAIDGDPNLDILLESGGSALGLAVPFSEREALPVSTLTALSLTRRLVDAEPRLFIATSQRRLFREFYDLFIEIADCIQLEGLRPIDALQRALGKWRTLLEEVSPLSTEAQIGLIGELWLLARLVAGNSPVALDSWTGPLGEPHDFRTSLAAIEVKASLSRRHVHTVSSLEQLSHEPETRLFVLSLLLEPAGGDGGHSLATAVAALRGLLSPDQTRLDRFDQLLATAIGFNDAMAAHYRLRYKLRSAPRLFEVTEGFPRLTRPMLQTQLGPNSLRIVDAEYIVDFEGLDYLDVNASEGVVPKSAVGDLL
jgi:hypothetical protein